MLAASASKPTASKTRKLPKGEIVGTYYGEPLIFNENTHRYFLGFDAIPSVTTILGRLNKPMLLAWAAERSIEAIKEMLPPDENGNYLIHTEMLDRCKTAYDRIREEAADVGKVVHKYAECVLSGFPLPEVPADPAINKAIAAFNEWLASNKVEPIELERRVVSKELFFAGTTDFYGIINGKRCILDFKTGKGIYDEYWLQTEAYALALEEETGQAVAEKHIIRLDKKVGDFEAAQMPVSPVHRDAFVALSKFDALMRRFKEVA